MTKSKISEWCEKVIEGCGGMNDFEKYELVVWNEPERIATAKWVIRCLANPESEGSEYVLNEIIERRKEVLERKK